MLQEELPVPMTPGNYQRRTSTCLLQRNFQSVVAKQEGFAWTNERPGAEESRHKWGWIATIPGSWVELVVDTTTDLEVTSGSHLVGLFGVGAYRPLSTPKGMCPTCRVSSRLSKSRSSSLI